MNQLFSKNLLGLLGISLLAFSPQSTTALVASNVAVIVNSGSTNTIGYRIYVSPSGQVNYVDGEGSGKGKLSDKLTKRFFKHLNAAQPLSSLSVGSCVKSASFGTTTTVSIGSERSQDISCPGDDQSENLDSDVNAITHIIGVKNVPNSQGTPLPPINF